MIRNEAINPEPEISIPSPKSQILNPIDPNPQTRNPIDPIMKN